MGNLRDLTGQKFNRLTVIERATSTNCGSVRWLCRCDCGNLTTVSRSNILSGGTKSCGCWNRERPRPPTKHGLHKHRLHNIWTLMKQRCLNPNAANYHRYGGRGITICEEWQTFKPFYDWATANGYGNNLTLDRVNNDKGYSPDNCRWATKLEQAHNTSACISATINGETKPIAAWASQYGLEASSVRTRYKRGDRGEQLIRPRKITRKVKEPTYPADQSKALTLPQATAEAE